MNSRSHFEFVSMMRARNRKEEKTPESIEDAPRYYTVKTIGHILQDKRGPIWVSPGAMRQMKDIIGNPKGQIKI